MFSIVKKEKETAGKTQILSTNLFLSKFAEKQLRNANYLR